MIKKLRNLSPVSNLRSLINILSSFRYFSIDQQKILFCLALLVLGILYFKFYYRSHLPHVEFTQEIAVEILGEVNKPGLYIFKHSPTLGEAIQRAGGLKEYALFDEESSSKVLESGTLINVEKRLEKEVRIRIERMEARKLLLFSIPLDLNKVSIEDLCLIPGIGESLAQEILTYRKKRNGFRSVEELKNVRGIGEKNFKSLRNFFIINPPKK